MKFEFKVSPSFHFLTAFGEKFGMPVREHAVELPSTMGKGCIKLIDIEAGCKLVIHRYTLRQSFHLKRLPGEEPGDLISIVFNSNEIPTGSSDDRLATEQFLHMHGSAIQIASSILGSETRFARDTEVHFAVVGIRAGVLAAILRLEKSNKLIESILEGKTTFFYHEPMSAGMGSLLKELSQIDETANLSNLHYRIKV